MGSTIEKVSTETFQDAPAKNGRANVKLFSGHLFEKNPNQSPQTLILVNKTLYMNAGFSNFEHECGTLAATVLSFKRLSQKIFFLSVYGQKSMDGILLGEDQRERLLRSAEEFMLTREESDNVFFCGNLNMDCPKLARNSSAADSSIDDSDDMLTPFLERMKANGREICLLNAPGSATRQNPIFRDRFSTSDYSFVTNNGHASVLGGQCYIENDNNPPTKHYPLWFYLK